VRRIQLGRENPDTPLPPVTNCEFLSCLDDCCYSEFAYLQYEGFVRTAFVAHYILERPECLATYEGVTICVIGRTPSARWRGALQ